MLLAGAVGGSALLSLMSGMDRFRSGLDVDGFLARRIDFTLLEMAAGSLQVGLAMVAVLLVPAYWTARFAKPSLVWFLVISIGLPTGLVLLWTLFLIVPEIADFMRNADSFQPVNLTYLPNYLGPAVFLIATSLAALAYLIVAKSVRSSS
ncbi:hypothetical protein IWC96_10990 [Brevundimonas sp. BAL450]|jgi:hypothetical protein|uniref:hypothetical protein n=1 Tax=Brevundimonas TaxID=41275 RepID=UPI0018CB47D7|nr:MULTISPECIES: hypothetical protein [Brevundimonas]MBG7615800.1 hypothetical protein [Brevundimonas sp. BAL450]